MKKILSLLAIILFSTTLFAKPNLNKLSAKSEDGTMIYFDENNCNTFRYVYNGITRIGEFRITKDNCDKRTGRGSAEFTATLSFSDGERTFTGTLSYHATKGGVISITFNGTRFYNPMYL